MTTIPCCAPALNAACCCIYRQHQQISTNQWINESINHLSSKKPKALSWLNGSGWNLAGMFLIQICIDWQSRIFSLTSSFEDGAHRSFHTEKCYCLVSKHKAAVHAHTYVVEYNSSWFIVHSYLFLYYTINLCFKNLAHKKFKGALKHWYNRPEATSSIDTDSY